MSFRIEHKSQREKVSVKLIEGALALAAAQGYGSLSLRSVAREAGIAPTSFYRHFRDMDELGLSMAHLAEKELLEGMKDALARLAQRPVKTDLPGLESFLRAFGESFFRTLEKNEILYLFFFREWSGASPVIRDAVGQGIDRTCKLLAPILEKAGAGGPDSRTTAHSLMTLFIRAALSALLSEQDKRSQALSRVCNQGALLLLGAARAG